jgi:hypothetical protein
VGFIDMFDAAGTAANEDQPGRIDQHHADAGPVRQVLVARHVPYVSFVCIKSIRNRSVRRSPGKVRIAVISLISIAFSSEVDAASREENASKQESRASVLIESEPKL